MAVEKPAATLVSSLGFLLYLSTCCGIMPYSVRAYYRHAVFQLSMFGNVWVAMNSVHFVVHYHLATQFFSVDDKDETGTLTTIIGIVIIYMEPLMLSIDVIGFMINQKSLIALLQRMQRVDDKLLKENIEINYSKIRRMTYALIALIFVLEFSLVTYNFVLFRLESFWYFITCVPLFLSSISKVWYIVLVFNVKQKFEAINNHFEGTAAFFGELRKRNAKAKQKLSDLEDEGERSAHGDSVDHGGYLQREIYAKPLFKRNRVQPGGIGARSGVSTMSHNEIVLVQPINGDDGKPLTTDLQPFNSDMFVFSENSRFIIESKLNKKLTRLCQLHDEICDIGKQINQMFSFQMLILMAYGFMSLTAKFYFVYCGLTDQNIPILFRAAKNLMISMTFIVYTGAKCVYVIFTSWQTKLVAQKTGVKIHKVANVVDEDQCYQMVNHLSLKLLNHHLSFTACGFFELDMTTLYAITGAITSYLIILIQFNLASQRTKKGPAGGNSTAVTNSSSM